MKHLPHLPSSEAGQAMSLRRGTGRGGAPFEVSAGEGLHVGLVSHWRLSDLTDAHGSNTLTNNGTTTFAAGKLGNAAVFDNTDTQWLSCADTAGLSMGGADASFAIACWLYLADKTVDRGAVTKTNYAADSAKEYDLSYSSASDRMVFTLRASGVGVTSVTANTFGAPPTNTWFFVACWYDDAANLLGIQVNDGAEDTVSYSSGGTNGSNDFNIGRRFHSLDMDGGDYWEGMIDSVSFWQRAPTEAEWTLLYNADAGLDYPFTS